MMNEAFTIAVPVHEFADDPAFRLLQKPILCAECSGDCVCEGYNGRDLVYRCLLCGSLTLDRLEISPLFAADVLHQATLRHYEIACPYCGAKAPLVGGDALNGLFFVCENRCHIHFTRYIRRY